MRDILKYQRHAVVGFGKEGRAVARFLIEAGISPVILDRKPVALWDEQDRAWCESQHLAVYSGDDYLTHLLDMEVAWRSPGVWRLNPSLKIFEEQGGIVTSQTQYFFEHCPATIIGVTGTKGKGTTSALISRMLDEAVRAQAFNGLSGRVLNAVSRVYLTGNIGVLDPLSFLAELESSDFVVFELSSFQLQDLALGPHIGVVLMVTEEHLDHHADAPEYVAAKGQIVAHQQDGDVGIINDDFENSRTIGSLGDGQKFLFSRQHEVVRGCFVRDDQVVLRGLAGLPHDDFVLCRVNDVALRGRHNLDNIAAATLAAWCAGVDIEVIRQVIFKFGGLEHRLELVAQKRGVAYYNDSFSTVPETAIAAIAAFHEPEILILGGSEKNSDFRELGRVIHEARNIVGIVLVGDTAPRIQRAIAEAGGFNGPLLEGARTMNEIMDQVAGLVHPGAVVLLSPACASFGMFRDYKDRGNQFKAAVAQLPN